MELKKIDVTKCFVDDSDGFWDGFGSAAMD